MKPFSTRLKLCLLTITIRVNKIQNPTSPASSENKNKKIVIGDGHAILFSIRASWRVNSNSYNGPLAGLLLFNYTVGYNNILRYCAGN